MTSTERLHQQDYDARHGNSREAFDFEVCDHCTELKRFCECKPCVKNCGRKAHSLSEHQCCAACELEAVTEDLRKEWLKPVQERDLLSHDIQVKIWTALRDEEEATGT